MKINYHVLIIVLLLLVFTGCYKEEVSYASDMDLVSTNHQEDFNFTARSTFAIPDSIVLLGDVKFDGTNRFAKSIYANDILAIIRSNMIKNGWKEIAAGANPDVILLPSISQTTEIHYYPDCQYWSWYYPANYYPQGWGWYYPGYYFPHKPTYKTGSLFIQMTDPSNASGSDQLPVVWTCIVNGLLEVNNASTHVRANAAIAQAFEQSSYLKK